MRVLVYNKKVSRKDGGKGVTNFQIDYSKEDAWYSPYRIDITNIDQFE